jgi:hypothetical protein
VPWEGTFHEHEGFRDFAKKSSSNSLWNCDGRCTSLSTSVTSGSLYFCARWAGRKVGTPSTTLPEAQVWKLRNGKVVDFEGYFDTSIVLRTLQLQPRAQCEA